MLIKYTHDVAFSEIFHGVRCRIPARFEGETTDELGAMLIKRGLAVAVAPKEQPKPAPKAEPVQEKAPAAKAERFDDDD